MKCQKTKSSTRKKQITIIKWVPPKEFLYVKEEYMVLISHRRDEIRKIKKSVWEYEDLGQPYNVSVKNDSLFESGKKARI